MFTTGLTQAQTLASIQAKLKALRDALGDIEDLYGWSSGIAATDLEADLQFNDADAQSILSAIADANALAQVYNTGNPPSSYPQASSVYVYSATQRQVIGPL